MHLPIGIVSEGGRVYTVSIVHDRPRNLTRHSWMMTSVVSALRRSSTARLLHTMMMSIFA